MFFVFGQLSTARVGCLPGAERLTGLCACQKCQLHSRATGVTGTAVSDSDGVVVHTLRNPLLPSENTHHRRDLPAKPSRKG